MSDNSLKWINDELHSILGISEKNLVHYIASISKSAKSSKEIYQKLTEDLELEANDKIKSFSDDLFTKFNSSATQVNQKQISDYEQHEKTLLKHKQQNESYKLVGKSDKPLLSRKTERPDPVGTSNPILDSDIININTIKDENIQNLLKEKDRLERDLLNEKLKEKDTQNKIKKPIENPLTAKIVLSEEDRQKVAEDLRKMSRYTYLKTRAAQQLDIFKRRLEDEKKLFKGVSLTKDEIKLNEINQKIYEMASQKINNEEGEDKYLIPIGYEDDTGRVDKDKKYKVLYERFKEKRKEETEEEIWEKAQKLKTLPKYGAQDLKKPSENFDLVFENQIDFVKKEVLEGLIYEKSKKHTDAPSLEPLAQINEPTERDIMLQTRKELPIYEYRDELLQAIRDYQVLIIVGETGSGKTTQIPQYLHEIGYTKYGRIGVTQPRRVAAMSVANRVAQEMDVKLGNEVGYSIRFEDCSNERTMIKYMTDGVFLRELLTEPDLKSYSCIIVDEAHERTLNTDIIFGLIKDISKYRKDLKILISSATLDAEKFRNYFNNAPVFKIPGRRYPVDIFYTKAPEADYIEAAVVTVLQIHVTQPIKGDILVFLTGQEEIEMAHDMLNTRLKGVSKKIPGLIILDIYSAMPSENQAQIFLPTPQGMRKVILATNIAETSITIDGIMYVIDCGMCKQSAFNPRLGLDKLVVTPVSKASANQRAGRAGRVGPGKCFRLYTAWSYQHELDSDNIPEVQRTNLTQIVLMLKSLGINHLISFDFIDPPPPENLIRALEQLYALGALNNDGDLTKLGRRMAEFPIDPCLAKAIIASAHYKVLDQMITIASMLSVGNNIFYRSKENSSNSDKIRSSFFRHGGDHFTYLTAFNQWKENNFSGLWCKDNYIQSKSMRKARDIKEQLMSTCERVEIDATDETLSKETNDISENIRKAILSGYFYNVAKLSKDGTYKTVKNMHSVNIHPSSSLIKENPSWVAYHELVYTSKEFMRELIEIKPEWLMEIAPHFYKNINLGETVKIKNKGTNKMNF